MRSRHNTVLVVTAAEASGARLCAALARQGLESTLVTDASEAIHRLADDAPAAIVVDLGFEEIDPEQIVHRALRCRETHGSPVIVLDSPGSRFDADALLASGCAAVLDAATPPLDVARRLAEHMQPPGR